MLGAATMASDDQIIERIGALTIGVLQSGPTGAPAEAASSLLAADLHCLASASDAALVRAIPLLVDLLALPAQHPLLAAVLRATVKATGCSDGAEGWSNVLWGSRRLVKLAGSLDLDDECRRLVDLAMAQSTGGIAAPTAIAFEEVHRGDMYPPTRFAFKRQLPADAACAAAATGAAPTGRDVAGAEEALMELRLENPSRRERFGSEIPSKVWPASVILAQWLWNAPHSVAGKRVLELGAGMGLVGLAAGRCGAASVLLTDLDAKALQHARTNIRKNARGGGGHACAAEAAHLDWARPPELEDEEGARGPAARVLWEGADVVLAADIVNAGGLSELVYAMLLRYLGRDGDFVMVCPKPVHRHSVERLRSLLLESEHFECTVDDVPPPLVTAARAVAAGASDMEPAEFDVLAYELYHARWRRGVVVS